MGLRFWNAVPNKRAAIARALGAVGGLRLLERLGADRRVVVLTYHRIAVPGAANPFYDPVVSATPEGLRDHLTMLHRRFRVIRADEILDAPPDDHDRRPRAVLTFDDGYRDNLTAAVPILAEFGAPAAFFIATDFLERPRLPWWDHVAFVVKSTGRSRFQVARTQDDPRPILVEPTGDRASATASLIQPVLNGEVPDLPAFLARLEEAAEVAVDSPALARDLFMTWADLRTLADAGHVVGSHAHGHVPLASLADDALRRELALSRSILETAIQRPVRTVAYPYGWAGAVDARTSRVAAAVGYRVGFTAAEGVVSPQALGLDPLALPRLTIGAGDDAPLIRSRAALWGALGRSWL